MKKIGTFVFLMLLSVLIFSQPVMANSRSMNLNNLVQSKTHIIPAINRADSKDRNEMLCLALNIYHEVRGGKPREQTAVGYVTLNRVKHKAFRENNICGIVWSKSQFSWTKRNISTQIPKERSVWIDIQQKAVSMFYGNIKNDPTNGSTHFFDHSIKSSWTNRLVNRFRLGNHVYAKLP